ncbi:MAG: TldD/PmbA family protein [Vibrio sp.]
MSQQDITNQAIDVLLEEAVKQGAEADIVIHSQEAFDLASYQGNIDRYEVANTRKVGIRIIKDQKVATGCSESFEPNDLKQMLHNLLESLPYTKTSQHQRITCAKQDTLTLDENINQPDEVDIEAKINLVLSVEEALRQQRNVENVTENYFSEANVQYQVANTLGVSCVHNERLLTYVAEVLCSHNQQQSVHASASLARHFDDLDTEFVIRHSTEIANGLLDGVPVATGHYDIIFAVDELSNIFTAFADAFSGKAAMQGLTPLTKRVGQQVGYDGLTLRDAPFQTGGMHIKAFDSEGFTRRNTTLIQNGVLLSLLHNSETASYFNTETTANAERMASLGVGSSHIVIDAGHHSLSDVQSGEYLELVQLHGTHSGADLVTGDFSFGASGFLCRDGERIQPVRGITVAGNFYTMLQNIVAIGQELEFDFLRAFYAPKVRFACLSIAGQ